MYPPPHYSSLILPFSFLLHTHTLPQLVTWTAWCCMKKHLYIAVGNHDEVEGRLRKSEASAHDWRLWLPSHSAHYLSISRRRWRRWWAASNLHISASRASAPPPPPPERATGSCTRSPSLLLLCPPPPLSLAFSCGRCDLPISLSRSDYRLRFRV